MMLRFMTHKHPTKQSETGGNVDLRMRVWFLTFYQNLLELLSLTAVFFSRQAALETSTRGRRSSPSEQQVWRSYSCVSTHHRGWAIKTAIKKKQTPSPRLPAASLGVRFFFLLFGKLHKLRDEELPLYEGDGDVGKKDEPGDRVHPPVEHVRHGDEGREVQAHKRESGLL